MRWMRGNSRSPSICFWSWGVASASIEAVRGSWPWMCTAACWEACCWAAAWAAATWCCCCCCWAATWKGAATGADTAVTWGGFRMAWVYL
uniref:Uncharacterized protein n=1 Tax=Ixodes ricinus TaxID=34613 RepID=A0A6B0U0N1_IXORI